MSSKKPQKLKFQNRANAKEQSNRQLSVPKNLSLLNPTGNKAFFLPYKK
jgi:hypothetical protein